MFLSDLEWLGMCTAKARRMEIRESLNPKSEQKRGDWSYEAV
jgi:hypothetical protein